jgi:hypothetical protein
MSPVHKPRLPFFVGHDPDVERLMELPAWERAKVYELAHIDLGERSMVEAEVRARIARRFRRGT